MFLSNVRVVFQSTVDKLLKKANVSLVVSTSSWKEQFVEAVTVNAGNVTKSRAWLRRYRASVTS